MPRLNFKMYERGEHRHYSEQTGYWKRSIADDFRHRFGHKPVSLGAEVIVPNPQRAHDQWRAMRRTTRTGRS